MGWKFDKRLAEIKELIRDLEATISVADEAGLLAVVPELNGVRGALYEMIWEISEKPLIAEVIGCLEGVRRLEDLVMERADLLDGSVE